MRKRSWWRSQLSPRLPENNFLENRDENAFRVFRLVSFGSVQLQLLPFGLCICLSWFWDICSKLLDMPDRISVIELLELLLGLSVSINLFRMSWVPKFVAVSDTVFTLSLFCALWSRILLFTMRSCSGSKLRWSTIGSTLRTSASSLSGMRSWLSLSSIGPGSCLVFVSAWGSFSRSPLSWSSLGSSSSDFSSCPISAFRSSDASLSRVRRALSIYSGEWRLDDDGPGSDSILIESSWVSENISLLELTTCCRRF